MSGVALSIERRLPFRSAADAADTVLAVTAVIAGASTSGQLWTEFRGSLVPLGREEFPRLLQWSSYIAADRPGAPTHIMDLYATPAAGARAGRLLLSLGEAAQGTSSSRGLRLTLTLAPNVFDLDAASLLLTLDRCIRAKAVDHAAVGAAAPAEGRAKWATFARRFKRDRLPVLARIVPTVGGSILVAHAEDPESTTSAALEAVRAVADALTAEALADRDVDVDVGAERVEPRDPDEGGAPAAIDELGLDGTREVHAALLDRPTTPFVDGAPSPAVSRPAARDAKPPASTGAAAPRAFETENVDVDKIRALVLPFGRGGAGRAQPAMTLEQYAMLRAALARNGADDLPTLIRFGVASLEAKKALETQFATLFRADPAAQARFLELLKQAGAVPSGPAAGNAPKPAAKTAEDDLDATAELRTIGVGPILPFGGGSEATARPATPAADAPGSGSAPPKNPSR